MDVLKWANTLMGEDDVVILDTETTGLELDDVIVEVAIIDMKGKVLLDQLVRPGRIISKAATAKHGIDYEMVRKAPGWLEVLPHVVEVVSGKRIVAYNAAFDKRMLLQSTKAVDAQWFMGPGASDLYNVSRVPQKYATPGLQWLCLMEAYAQFWGEPGRWPGSMKWQRLEEACAQQGITAEVQWHRALGDCKAELALLQKLSDLYEMSLETAKRRVENASVITNS